MYKCEPQAKDKLIEKLSSSRHNLNLFQVDQNWIVPIDHVENSTSKRGESNDLVAYDFFLIDYHD